MVTEKACTTPYPPRPAEPPREERPPVRVLFLHARRHLTPDLAVHYSLMAAFDPARTQAVVVSNSQASDADRHRQASEAVPGLSAYRLPLGGPAGDEGKGSLRGLAASLLSCLLVLPRLLALVRRHDIHLIHSTDRPRDILLATLLAALSGRPHVIHLHTNADAYQNRVIRWGFRRASAFLAVSEFIRREGLALGLPGWALHAVPNATDSAHFDPALFQSERSALRRSLRARFGLPEDAVVVGIIARVNEWKGQRELIDAVAALAAAHPRLHLLIVGGQADPSAFTAYEAQLAAQARANAVPDRVLFAGHFADVRPVLAALDIFALPSYAEPFGLAITEAMAMALPVIACRSGGVPEIIADRCTGLLVEPRCASSLADALAFLLAHPEDAAQMGRAARRQVQAAYAAEAIAGQVSDIYAAVLAARRSGRR